MEFARFTPATMAERYESGKLNRRGGGVRWEVHRVVTPFSEPVNERKELNGEGELWEKLGDVEFERRKAEFTRPWNRGRKKRVGILEGMCEALAMEVEGLKRQLGLTSNGSEELEQAAQHVVRNEDTVPGEELLEEMSEAQKDIAAELRKLQRGPQSARAEEI